MSKKNLIPVVLLIGTFVILFVATFFLPDKIPFHFDVNGEAGWYASKYFILLLTPVPYLIYLIYHLNKIIARCKMKLK